MTYRKLIDSLNRVPNNRLDDDVTVFDGNIGEFIPVDGMEIADDEQDVLDEGHVFLTIN